MTDPIVFLVPGGWRFRVFGTSSLVDRPSGRLCIWTILLYGYMGRRSHYTLKNEDTMTFMEAAPRMYHTLVQPLKIKFILYENIIVPVVNNNIDYKK